MEINTSRIEGAGPTTRWGSLSNFGIIRADVKGLMSVERTTDSVRILPSISGMRYNRATVSGTTGSSDFSPWMAESLRLSIFHPPGTDRFGLWAKLMGNSPDSRNERPREQTVLEEGPTGADKLILSTQDQRLDWTVGPSLPENPNDTRLLILADVGQGLDLMQRALQVTSPAVRDITRLAFGAILLQQVSDINEGASRLLQYLPFLDLENRAATDLLYQVNRSRRSLTVPHVSVNRLSRWSLELVQSGTFVIKAAQPLQVNTPQAQTVIKLILDINTAPGNSAISLSKMPGLLAEFIQFAQEISTKGDVS